MEDSRCVIELSLATRYRNVEEILLRYPGIDCLSIEYYISHGIMKGTDLRPLDTIRSPGYMKASITVDVMHRPKFWRF
jgi:hypothetical protein